MYPSQPIHNEDHTPYSGFALVVVLGLMLIISATLTPFLISSRITALMADNAFKNYRYSRVEEILSEVAVKKIASYLKAGKLTKTHIPGATKCIVGDYSIVLGMQEHAGLIDLNTAGLGLLKVGFKSLGLAEKQSSMLALAVDIYRRQDLLHQIEIPADLVGSAGFKHGAFEDVLELQEFPILQNFSPIDIANTFTVSARTGTFIPSAAPTHIKNILSTGGSSAIPASGSVSGPLTLFIDVFRGGKLVYASSDVFDIYSGYVTYVSSIPISTSAASSKILSGYGLQCEQLIERHVLSAVESSLQ